LSPDPILGKYLNGQVNDGVFSPRNLAAYGFGWGNPIANRDPDGRSPEVGEVIYDYDPNSFGEKFQRFIARLPLPDIPASADAFFYGVASESTFGFGFGIGTSLMEGLRGRAAPDPESEALKYGERLAFGLAIADVSLNIGARSVKKLVGLAKSGAFGESLGSVIKGLNRNDLLRFGGGPGREGQYIGRLSVGSKKIPQRLSGWMSQENFDFLRHVDFGVESVRPSMKAIGTFVRSSDLLTYPVRGHLD